MTDLEACAYNRRQVDAFASRNPELAAAIGEALARALKLTGQATVVLGQLKSAERVAHFLVEMDALFRERNVAQTPLSPMMNRNQIAGYLGLTIETVSRAFGKLEKWGVIDVGGNDEAAILDRARLREIGKT